MAQLRSWTVVDVNFAAVLDSPDASFTPDDLLRCGRHRNATQRTTCSVGEP